MMPGFAQAQEETERTGMPAVEGIAVRFATPAAAKAAAARLTEILAAPVVKEGDVTPGMREPGGKWQGTWEAAPRKNAKGKEEAWLIARPVGDAPPPLDLAWEAIREIRDAENGLPGVLSAEPLLLTIAPVTNGSDAQEAFQLWGHISDERLAAIQAASDKDHLHWSLDAMNVPAAWGKWRERNPGKIPGDGVLVAHPDTGYTKHPHLLPVLKPHTDDKNLRGKNFVERDKPDAEDPMQDRTFLNFPGHGTQTASVIAAGGEENKPWGVAPGAKILPLRVSSTVIHLSFQNLCDALDEAVEQKADVISLSLGGPVGSELLTSKVWAALDAGIIVVAAAGNFVPTVMFPARIPGVIACAASNALTRPWRFSGMGGEVVITAPGELVWHDWTYNPDDPIKGFLQRNGSGTSFSTANVAGLAALWLSFHGKKELKEKYGAGNIPFAFRYCLQESSKKEADFIQNGGFGRGMAQADTLLEIPLPDPKTVQAIHDALFAEQDEYLVGAQPGYWWAMITLPTLAPGPDGTPQAPALARIQTKAGPEPNPDAPASEREAYAVQRMTALRIAAQTDAQRQAERTDDLFREIVTGDVFEEKEGAASAARSDAPPTFEPVDRQEMTALAASDIGLRRAVARIAQRGRNAVSAAAVRRYLLRPGSPISSALRGKLEKARTNAQKLWRGDHPELAETPFFVPSAAAEAKKTAYAVGAPATRRLRAYAFDPSLATKSDSAAANEITIPVVFERGLGPGPVGDYVEVVDVDPASDCAYAPVDLNHPFLLAQDGLPRSEGNPQFHQQMVYAVAMKTISHFEEALGRPIFWSPLRPWNDDSGDDQRADYRVRDAQGNFQREANGRYTYNYKNVADRFVQRLRLYPHAMREQNAYYSPQKRAILFGYFPAGDGDPGAEYPGGVIFTCLAHDIIAHETTHAILDGMHVHFTEPTNPDVFAFHEAFADIVALFQRFTYPELLRDQIARARGRLDAGTLMSRLALQFGQATGRHQALRDALGRVVRQTRVKAAQEFRDVREERKMDGGEAQASLADAAYEFDEENRLLWKRFQADPSLLAKVEEPHERGSFLVAAVFDAYLCIYEDRVADLKRIATGGTGVLPDGELHPDLVNRMAEEAAKSAGHVLKICIRAMDYTPPVDITFGEFLRALITADADLVPDDPRRYRVAFIEAFRKWGIYPRDVRTLSEETLRWSPPNPAKADLFPYVMNLSDDAAQRKIAALRKVRTALLGWRPGEPREGIFNQVREAQAMLHEYLKNVRPEVKDELLGGIDTTRSFQVTNLRPARRIGPNGEFLTEMVFEVIQNKQEPDNTTETSVAGRKLPFRGGVTLIVSMDDYSVRYAIHKSLDSATREARQQDFLLRAGGSGNPDAAEYSSQFLPNGWYSNAALRAEWMGKRTTAPDAMRASSCACRRKDMENAAQNAGVTVPNPLTEPFALLHRG